MAVVVQSFRTTTQRTLGMLIDLKRWEIRYWMDGNFKERKMKKLEKHCAYHALVLIREAGNHVVLNPFSRRPECVGNIGNDFKNFIS